MKALIVEDEAPAARRLKKLIQEIVPDVEILNVIESIEGAIKWFNTNAAPDLCFFDIQLADGLSFEIFQKIKISSPVIFTTAYDEYALKAFRVNSVDYLLKPIEVNDLKNSLFKFKELQSIFNPQDKLDAIQRLLNSYKTSNKEYKTRFLVKLGERLISVEVSDILYIKSEDKLTFIFTRNFARYLTDYTLEQLEDLLDPAVFFRINRQYIAHITSIESIHNYFNGKLKVYLKQKEKEEIIISREKAPFFKDWLGQ